VTADDRNEVPAGDHGDQDAGAGLPEETCPAGPYWEVRVGHGGKLTATLAGTQPPLTITAPDEASLRKQIRTVMLQAML
jgi:hypothetical protein